MRKASKEYLEKLYKLAGDEYTFIGEYINSQTKIKVRHNCEACGNHEYEVFPVNFMSGQRCPACFRKYKKTDEQFRKEVYDLVGDNYTVLGTYEGIHEKILMRHNCDECNNHEYEVSPNNFFSGTRCPECARIKLTKRVALNKKTLEEFKQEVFDLVGDEYTVLGEYENNHTKIRIRHNCEVCNNFEYDILPNNFLLGIRCTKCSGKKKRTTEEFKEEVYNLVGDEYTVLGEYKNRKTKIKMRHNCEDCGNHEYEVNPSAFLNGTRCPKCAGVGKKTDEQFKQDVYDLVGSEYTVLGDYEGTHKKILMRHNCESCGNYEYEVRPCNFLSGSRCPECARKKPKRIKK